MNHLDGFGSGFVLVLLARRFTVPPISSINPLPSLRSKCFVQVLPDFGLLLRRHFLHRLECLFRQLLCRYAVHSGLPALGAASNVRSSNLRC